MEELSMTVTNKLIGVILIAGSIGFTGPALADAGKPGQVVKITASKFRFTPDHITLVKGQPVTLQITSTDATHGFMIRALKIDTDVKPGRVTEVTVTPRTAGTFTAICDHYCGLGHNAMKMTVSVREEAASAPTESLAAINTGK
jgi:cytochrome c oxidase subunit II